MKEVYIITETGYEYDDNYYVLSESSASHVKDVFSTMEAAVAHKNKLEELFVLDFRVSDFSDVWYDYQKEFEMYGLKYNNTFEDAKNVMDKAMFAQIMMDLGMFKIKKMTIKD